MSAALLNHQIAELETRIQTANLAPATPPPKVGRIDDEVERAEVMTHDEEFEVEDFIDEDDDAWRVIVLEASVLIWALRSVRRIVAKGWEVIVPLESTFTLRRVLI